MINIFTNLSFKWTYVHLLFLILRVEYCFTLKSDQCKTDNQEEIMKIKLFISALIISGLPVLGYAQDKAAEQPQQLPATAGQGVYVDENNNGICDNFEMRGAYYGFGRGQAAAPGYGRARAGVQGYGRGQAAAPGYGRAQAGVQGYGKGQAAVQGRGWGPGSGWGRAMTPGQGRGLGPAKNWGRGLGPGQGQGLAPGGRFFTDKNQNGICDFYEESLKK